jgi:hypothetical protein
MSATPPPDGGGPSASGPDDADPEVLRAQVAELRDQLREVEHERARGFWQRSRSPIAVILIVIGSVLAPLSVVTVFVRNQVLNTDTYVSTVAPLGSDPAIQSLVADQVTSQLFARVDVKSEIEGLLPHRAAPLAGPIASGVHTVVQRVADQFTRSGRFEKLWLQINRAAHRQIVGALTGKGGGAVSADHNGVVKLDLHVVAVRVQEQLVASGLTVFEKIPTDKIGGSVVLFQSDNLVKLQRATRVLNSAAYAVPIVSLLCYAAAIAVSRRRRRTVFEVGIALAASMAVLGVALGIARTILIDATANTSVTPAAAMSFFDTFLRNVRLAIRIIAVIGLVVALAAWIPGPSRPATALRRAVQRAWDWFVRGVRSRKWDYGTAGAWVQQNRSWVQAIIGGVAFVILAFFTPGWFGSLIVIIVAVAAILFLRGMGGGPSDGAGSDGGRQPSDAVTVSGPD